MNAFSLEELSAELDHIQNQKDLSLQDHIDQCLKQTYKINQFDEIIQALNSNNLFQEYFGVIGLQKLLCAEDPPVKRAFKAEILPKLVEFMQRGDQPKLQREAALAITNLASGATGEQMKQIFGSGATPVLVMLLESPDNEVKEQAIWALGNMSADWAEARDHTLKAGAIYPLIRIIEEAISEGNLSQVKNGTWALSNLCRGKPLPAYNMTKDAMPVLARVIMTQDDADILADAIWPLTFLSDGSDRIQGILDTGVVPFLAKLLDHSSLVVMMPSIRTIGNLLTGTSEQTNFVMAVPGMMEGISRLLAHKKRAIRREAVVALSNIAAGTPESLEFLFVNACYLNQILEISLEETASDAVIRQEAVSVLSNAIKMANQRQLQMLLEKGIIKHFNKIIKKDEDHRVHVAVLKGIVNLLSRERLSFPEGYSSDGCRTLFDMEKILKLKESQNREVAKLAHSVLGLEYVAQKIEEEEEEENFEENKDEY